MQADRLSIRDVGGGTEVTETRTLDTNAAYSFPAGLLGTG
jgi:hypothetical protein